MTAVLEDLRVLPDTAVADVYDAAGDDAAARAALAELGRRDAADRLERARDVLAHIRAEGEAAVYAQYLQASDWTRGRMLSREGMAAGITEEQLWRIPEDRAMRLGSEELGDFWTFVQPRITAAEFVRQHAAESRAARLEALDRAGAEASDDITEGITDGREHDSEGQGLAVDGSGAFRLGPAAEAAPEAGTAGTVQRGGRGAEHDAEDELAEAAAGWPGRPARPARPARGVKMTAAYTTFAEIQPLPAEPLWPGYWPRGEVVGWFGDGGIGKGRAIIDLVARVTRGDPMPFCTGQAAPGTVILVQPEDNAHEQIRPRLDAARADVSRVIDMTRLPTGARLKLSATPTKDGDVGQLRECVETLREQGRNPRLLIIDPVAATVGWGSIQTNAGARRLLEPLQDLAQSTGITVLLVMHTTKDGKLQGSSGVMQALRAVYRVSKDVNPMVRVISLEKANNQGETPDAKFTLEDSADGVKVVWLDRAEQDKRARSWREAPSAAPAGDGLAETLAGVHRLGQALRDLPDRVAVTRTVPERHLTALVGIQRPGQDRPQVAALDRFPADDAGWRLARMRCEADPRFRRDTAWQQGKDGGLLARYATSDGTVVRFAVLPMAS